MLSQRNHPNGREQDLGNMSRSKDKENEELKEIETDGSDIEVEEDPYDDDVPAPVEDNVRAVFDKIMKKVTGRKLNWKSKADRKVFAQEHDQILDQRTAAEGQTLLHMIATSGTSYKPLAAYLLQKYPHLVRFKDEGDKTAPYIAILKNNISLLTSLYDKCEDLDKALAQKCGFENSMHAAIRSKLGAELTIKLISKASVATLSAQDQHGRTPLHIAVEYDRCTDSQLEVIQTLIARGDRALDFFTKQPYEFSVYEHHLDTRKKAERALVTARTEVTRGEDAKVISRSNPLKSQKHEDMREELAKTAVESKGGIPPEASHENETKAPLGPGALERRSSYFVPAPNPKERVNGSDHKANYQANEARQYKNALSVLSEGHGLENPAPRTPDGTESGRGSVENALLTLSKKIPAKEEKNKPKEEEKVSKESAEAVKLELQLHFLRTTFTTRDHDMAVRFLYGPNTEDVQIFFEFVKASAAIREDDFMASSKHIKFDAVLRHVEFQSVQLHSSPTGSKFKKKLTEEETGRGRKDMVFFFEWLRKKDVVRILKVIVDESQPVAHSDEAIERALDGFHVEILDWRKVDLCPDTIVTACPELRAIYLCWSGNNAVLRAWSEPEGLARLTNLTQVHLHVKQDLESSNRTSLNIRRFRERLQKIRTNIEVYLVEKGQSERLVTSTPAKTNGIKDEPKLSPHKWLDCMDEFADEVQSIIPPQSKTDELNKPIKVALIDDGVDIYHSSLRDKILSGISFDHGYPREKVPTPYHVTSTGHGTVMANMICRVCPSAKLLVLKLETQTTKETGTQISAKSAALAVEAAVARKVQIISMSWTIKETEDNHEDIKALEAAMSNAWERGILMFCSASDKGAHHDKDYPAAYNPARIFRIGAAKANGYVWESAGDLRNLDFIFPGHEVVSRNAHGAPMEGFQPNTGSSVATALAAGLAALIIHCVRLGAIYTQTLGTVNPGPGAVTTKNFVDVKKHDSMKAVFRAIGTSDDGGHKFIEVWSRFEKATKRLKEERDGKLEVIADLASGLVS